MTAASYRIKAMPAISREELTREDVLRVVSYDPATGVFRWKITTRGHGKMLFPGDEAGWSCDGYRQLSLYQEEYRAHRIAWLVMTGAWPPAGVEIDHRDRTRSNNAWENLRLGTRSQNNMNSKVRVDNSSGFRGVHRSRNGKWFARICKDKKIVGLGTFDTIEAAATARAHAERSMFGNFATA